MRAKRASVTQGIALVLAVSSGGCDAGSNESRRDTPTAPEATSTETSAPPPASATSTSAAVASAPSRIFAKALPDGFVYFDDGIAKHGRAPLVAVVVPAAHAKRFFFVGSKASVRFWTPTVDQVFALNDALLKLTEQEPRLARQIHTYRYQIIGIDDGEQRLFVNAFCKDQAQPSSQPSSCSDSWDLDLEGGRWERWPADECTQHDWLRKPVIVDDGGACYFNVQVHPTTGAISALEINGEA